MALTTINSGGVKDDSIVNADIKSDAAIALSKLASTPAVLTGSTDNTITTVTAANAIQGEANLTFDGTSLKLGQTQSKINLNTSDASDNKYLSIHGGGDSSQTRGAGITFYGNEVGSNEGRLWIGAGNSGSANGFISFNTGGSERARITHDGHFTMSNDSSKLKLGTSNDLQIYHDGSHSYIKDTGASHLRLENDNIRMRNAAGDELMFTATANDSVSLYYNGTKTIETKSWGAYVFGDLNVSGGDLLINSADNLKLKMGAANDLQIYHDGSHSYLQNGTGTLFIRAKTTETGIAVIPDGSVELYYNNIKTCYTSNGALAFPDSQAIFMGAGNDLQIIHDGSHSRIKDAGTGYLILNTDTGVLIKNGADDENIAIFTPDGAVSLYYNNSKRFETHADGVQFNDDVKLLIGTHHDLHIFHNGTHNYFTSTNGGMYFTTPSNAGEIHFIVDGDETAIQCVPDGPVILFNNGAEKLRTQPWGAQCKGNFLPDGDDNHNLGASNERWSNIYSADIHLDNTGGGGNEVDGSEGSWTIQEGANDLFLLNRTNNKKYKFNLTEIT